MQPNSLLWLTLSNSLAVFGHQPNFLFAAFNTVNIAACLREMDKSSTSPHCLTAPAGCGDKTLGLRICGEVERNAHDSPERERRPPLPDTGAVREESELKGILV